MKQHAEAGQTSFNLTQGRESFRNLVDLFLRFVEQYSHQQFACHVRNEQTRELSIQTFKESVLSLSQFLLSKGLKPGDRVAIYMENCPEWHISDFAILGSRMVVVPIYPNISPKQLLYILEQSQCRGIILGETEQWKLLASVANRLPLLETVIVSPLFPGQDSGVVTWDEAIAGSPGSTALARLQRARAEISPGTTATIVYTSGTTGPPKGVVLTHANLVSDLEQCLRRLDFQQPEQAASFLPLSHVFERLLCYGYFSQGVPIAYCSPPDLPTLLGKYRPVVMGCVPRALEKIHEAVMQEISIKPLPIRQLARRLIQLGESHLGEGIVGHQPPRVLSIPHRLADRLLFSRLRQKLGGRLRFLICGGAPLSVKLEKFFSAAGVTVVQGYGLSEASPVVSLNAMSRVKLGTVGQPLDETEVRISEEGEILVRGPQVMRGYYQDMEGTAQVIRDGWLHTGDLGYVDPFGYLVITGRKKEMLVTAGGKNVAPAAVESRLRESPFIEEAVLVGDGRKFLSALLVPNLACLQHHLAEQGIALADQELYESDLVAKIFENELRRTQQDLARYERAKRFCLIRKEQLQIPELMTPTQKIRRHALEVHFKDLIEKLYS
ncbi:MAG TPA: long-chain fatty acid--CoA ligase [Acidobacteriota bacterium]|nr:long-chain fatty acid--CoA ligase [Acidobacteriota bacterium]